MQKKKKIIDRSVNTFLFFLLLIFIVRSNQLFSQTKEMGKFKQGKFYFKELSKDNYSIRNKNSQKSYYSNGKINDYSLKWINDSTFVLTFIKSNMRETLFQKGDTIRVTITNIKEDCFEFLSEYKGKTYPKTWMCKE